MKKIITLSVCLILFLQINLSFAQLTYPDIAPILINRCTSCHHPSQHAPSFATYFDVSEHAGSIVLKLAANEMPPWSPDTTYSRFMHERIISNAEKNAILSWIGNGYPAGDTTLAPPLPFYSPYKLNGTPDLVLTMPSFVSNATTNDSYVCISIPTGLTQNRYLRAFEIVPGNAAIVHHVLVNLDTVGNTSTDLSGSCYNIPGIGIGAYAPGSAPTVYPSQAPLRAGVRIKAGSKIVLQMHYPAGSAGQADATSIRLYFYPIGATGVRTMYSTASLTNWTLNIPANTTQNYTAVYPTSGGLTAPISIFAAFPHSHKICRNMTNYAYQAADTIKLIRINDWQFDWQGFYTFKMLQKIPTGYKLKAEHFYDNTVNNPYNPSDPPVNVVAGFSTSNEMLFDSFQWMYYQAGDELINIETLLNTDSLLATDVTTLAPEAVYKPLIYPNPANDMLNVQLAQNAQYLLQLYSLTGELVSTVNFTGIAHQIDVSTLSKGLYLLGITNLNSNERFTKKVIKN